jgi:hypothetical protein
MPSYLQLPAESVEWQDEDFSCRKLITVKKEVVHGSPVNIPVKVDFDGDDEQMFYAMSNYKDGAMLRVYTVDGEEIPCEAGVRYDGQGGRQLRLFFLAPSLSSAEDTGFYLYYGVTSDMPRTFADSDVWLPRCLGVWHDNYEVVGKFAQSRGDY